MVPVDLRPALKALASVVVALFVALAVATPAHAQDTGQNQFQEANEECRDGSGDGLFDGGLLGGTGATEWLRDSAHAGGLRESLTTLPRVVTSGTCIAAGTVQHPGDAIQAAADAAWDGKLAGIVREIKDGNPAVIGYTLTLWTKFKLNPDALELSSSGINNLVWQGAIAGLALSLVIGLLKVASTRRQGSGEAMEDAAAAYGRYLLYGALVPALAIPAIMAFDGFADVLVNTYIADAGNFTKITDAVTIGEDMNPILVLVFVLISLIGSLAMCLAMVMRIILLPILIGLMPIFAAWAIGRAGRFTVENAMGVLVAFALLKVAAAFVYMSAVWAAMNLDGSEENKLVSLVLFGAAGLCAPALLAIILPQMKGQAGGSAGALGGAALGATGAVVGGTVAAAATGGAGALAAGGAAAGAAGSGGGSALGLTDGGSGGSGGGASGGRGPSGGGDPSGGGPSTGGGSRGGPTTGGSGGGGAGALGSGPSTGGGQQVAAAGQTGARIARNAAGMAGSALRAGGGILDDSVGAPVNPGSAYR